MRMLDVLGRSTLYRILQVREASQRKSLQGLDNTAASGAEGFEILEKIVDTLQEHGADAKWSEETKNDLKTGKLYLKTSYRSHCRHDDSQCPDHCRKFALSDEADANFQTK